VGELNGEKIDVVMWDPDTSVFITNALSPAQVLSVDLDEENGVATVVVPDKQLSLAIGKEGQNARLAAKLTGWRIDIKAASVAEEERVAEAKLLPQTEEEAIAGEEPPAETLAVPELAVVSAEEPVGEAAIPLPPLDTTFVPPLVSFEPQPTIDKTQVRFAEDILGPAKPGAKSKKRKKKGTPGKESAEDGIKLRKVRRVSEVAMDDDEY